MGKDKDPILGHFFERSWVLLLLLLLLFIYVAASFQK
jgi:hypothetical protein